jgi:hypothetical protein
MCRSSILGNRAGANTYCSASLILLSKRVSEQGLTFDERVVC